MSTSPAGRNLLLFLKGIGMGAADVVPGVSGGTIAFITGIYSELVDSLRSIDLEAIRILAKGRIKDFWKKINGTFLLFLFSGILASIFSLARLMQFLLGTYPVLVWSFFFGLILISGIFILRKINGWTAGKAISFIAGVAAMVAVTMFSPAETTERYWFIFLSGAIAICAMILPGISGAFILLILGKYSFILRAVSTLDIPVLAVFGAGVIIGLLSFSRLLSWLLLRYHDITVSLLAGFIFGSLFKIWPWKETVSTMVNSHGELVPVIQRNIFPGRFAGISGTDPMIFAAAGMFVAGIMLVLLLEKIAKRYK